MINILYWFCFVFMIAQAVVYFYRILKSTPNDCATTVQKVGDFFGGVIGVICQIGVIYFYLH